MRVVIAGAGFGGLELATLLSEAFGADADVVLIDKAPEFVFGFSKLDVMFGRTSAEHVVHRYADVVRPGLRFVQTTVRALDPVARRVTTDDGTFDADILVVATRRRCRSGGHPWACRRRARVLHSRGGVRAA